MNYIDEPLERIDMKWIVVHSMDGTTRHVRTFCNLSEAYQHFQQVQGNLYQRGDHLIIIKDDILEEVLIERRLIIK